MEEIRIAILGFGSANRALARMLLDKSEPSASDGNRPRRRRRRRLRIPIARSGGGDGARSVPWRVVCIVTRSHGRVCVPLSTTDPKGEPSCEIDLEGALARAESGGMLDDPALVLGPPDAREHGIVADAWTDPERTANLLGLLGSTGTANMVVEAVPGDSRGGGGPAISFVAAALGSGMHVASANKSPLAHRVGDEETYRALRRLARDNGVMYEHESAVMDGAPVFSLWRALPRAELVSLRGCLNSTTTLILTRMEGDLDDGECSGESFEEALDAARRLGIVEEDEGLDVDGYDAAAKLRALLVYCQDEIPVPTMDEIPRDSIRNVTREDIRRAYADGGKRYRLVASAELVDSSSASEGRSTRDGNNPSARDRPAAREWAPSVRLRPLPPSDPLYDLSGTDASVQFCTDVLGPVTVVSSGPTLADTAYGLFSDIVRIASESKT